MFHFLLVILLLPGRKANHEILLLFKEDDMDIKLLKHIRYLSLNSVFILHLVIFIPQ